MGNRDLFPGDQAIAARANLFGDQRECRTDPNLDFVDCHFAFEVPANEVAVPMESVQPAGDDPHQPYSVFESLVMVI